MSFLIRQTLIYAIPLMIVALAGIFAERSGIINLALEGIMIFGAFIGVLFVRILQATGCFDAAKAAGEWMALQGYMFLTMLVAAALGAVFSLLLAFAAINLKADQTIGGTALNMLAPALVLFLIRVIANQNTLQMLSGDSASWFMIKKTTLGFDRGADIGFHADAECVTQVGNDVIQHRPQHIGREDDPHEQEERAERILRQQRPHRVARDDRVSQIDQRHDQRAGQVEKKQAPVRPEKGEKDGKSGPRPVLLCRHDRCSVSA